MSSQGQEDLLLRMLFDVIGTTNQVAVEIGARDGVKGSNTHQLRLQGWTCVLLDAHPKGPIVHRAFVTAENINAILASHQVPHDFDLLSIDIDGNDFHVWRAMDARPRAVVIEYNSLFGPEQSAVVRYDPLHCWDRTAYYGASAAALVKLGTERGYRLVDYTPQLNLIFAHADAVSADLVPTIAVPPADPYGYPSAKGRRWEAY